MENNIEEIIKIIERKIKEAEHYTDITGLCLTLDKELCNAFINILSEYKKVLKENEELNNRCRNLDKEAQAYLEELAGDNTLTRRTIKQLQEENEELKEERQIVGIPVRNKRDRRIGIVLHQWESGSVAVLESINPRVINTHDSWNTLEIVTDEVKQTPPPEPQLPTKTICESFSKKVRNK